MRLQIQSTIPAAISEKIPTLNAIISIDINDETVDGIVMYFERMATSLPNKGLDK
jgi:hypothetical protein